VRLFDTTVTTRESDHLILKIFLFVRFIIQILFHISNNVETTKSFKNFSICTFYNSDFTFFSIFCFKKKKLPTPKDDLC
jgi:hypothetical protein